MILCVLRYWRYLNMHLSSEHAAKVLKSEMRGREYSAIVCPLHGLSDPRTGVHGGKHADWHRESFDVMLKRGGGLDADHDHSESRFDAEASRSFHATIPRPRLDYCKWKEAQLCKDPGLVVLGITRRGRASDLLVVSDEGKSAPILNGISAMTKGTVVIVWEATY